MFRRIESRRPVPGASIPGTIEPHDQGDTTSEFRDDNGIVAFDEDSIIHAAVRTPAGTFFSDPEEVKAMLIRPEPRYDLPVPPHLVNRPSGPSAASS